MIDIDSVRMYNEEIADMDQAIATAAPEGHPLRSTLVYLRDQAAGLCFDSCGCGTCGCDQRALDVFWDLLREMRR